MVSLFTPLVSPFTPCPKLPRSILYLHVNVFFVQDWVPSQQDKFNLSEAGFGEKRLVFLKVAGHSEFLKCLRETYSPLVGCGDIELLRSKPDDKTSLIVIPSSTIFCTTLLPVTKDMGLSFCSELN